CALSNNLFSAGSSMSRMPNCRNTGVRSMVQDTSEAIHPRHEKAATGSWGGRASFGAIVLARFRVALAWRPPRRVAMLAALFALVEYVYVFLCSAGRFERWPTYNVYYDLLAEGFRSGHLNIAASPSPGLLAKVNPYDPAYRHLWMWDVSLYKGKYY